MANLVLRDEKFCNMMLKHINDILQYLLFVDVNFSILVNLSEIDFQPPVPDEIRITFQPITMFTLAGYSFESMIVNEKMLSFETGFGPSNFGSVVSVPLLAILQIIVDEAPIFINLSVSSNISKKEKEKRGVKKSMDALLSNPENKKLFKK